MEKILATEQQVYTVSELNREAQLLLNESFPLLWISGEISNLSAPRSGHLYFSLKDKNAQVRCAMFRGQNHHLEFTPEDGMQVLVQAKVSLYEPRGDFQLIVRTMEETGDGLLRRKFEALKKKLVKAGLFDKDYKRELPEFPECLGIVTSSTGAAIRDVISVLKRRFPALPVIIYPTEVQGEKAAAQIVKAIQIANKRKECDVLLITRGGGSLEDLWPFNEEIVARAIFASEIPVVSAVGHEVDFTISDFVADLRAPTPSAAAELISPNLEEWEQTLDYYQQRLVHLVQTYFKHLKLHFINLQKRLQHPGQKLQAQAQQLNYLEQRLLRAFEIDLQTQRQKLSFLSQALNNLSPLATLNRGYSILRKANTIIRSTKNAQPGDKVTAQLSDGYLHCTVDKT